MLRKIYHRIKFAYEKTRVSQLITINPISTFLFFLLAGAGRTWRFHFGDVVFFARYSDWVAIDEIALRGEYDIVTDLLAKKHKPTVIDLGANIGLFSVLVFNLDPSATVYSVEPSCDTYQVLEKNRKANPKLNWQTYWSAIWVEDGEVSFTEDSKASTASYVNVVGGNTLVPSMSLDTLFSSCVKSSIDLLKIDIEGSEEEVLCQNLNLLSRAETIIVEIHPYRCDETRVIQTLQAVFDYLYDLGGCRGSTKPLLLASQTPYDFPVYSGIGES